MDAAAFSQYFFSQLTAFLEEASFHNMISFNHSETKKEEKKVTKNLPIYVMKIKITTIITIIIATIMK